MFVNQKGVTAMETNTQLPNQPRPQTDEEILARIRARRQQEEANPPLRIPGWVPGVILLAIVIGLWYGYQRLGVPDIPLCVVNTSSDSPWEIRLDNKKLGLAKRMLQEDPKYAVMAVLKPGKHTLEARDYSNSVVAQESFTVAKFSNGYLWTPKPDPNTTFFFEVAYYGENAAAPGRFNFSGYESLREFPSWVTQWFKDNPKTVVVKKWAKSDFERALRFKRRE
jgi:hypothetical protein